jgi:hypothetical protein
MNKILLTTTLTLGLVVAPLSAAPALAAPVHAAAAKPAAIELTAVKHASVNTGVLVDTADSTATVITKQGLSLIHWEQNRNSTTRGTWKVTVNQNRPQTGLSRTVKAEGVKAMIATLQRDGKGKTYAYADRAAVVRAVKSAVKGHTV